MSIKESNKDTEFLWNIFKNTGLIGVYLMYVEKNKEISNMMLKRTRKIKYGKRIRDFI